jgi:hypothetical protein
VIVVLHASPIANFEPIGKIVVVEEDVVEDLIEEVEEVDDVDEVVGIVVEELVVVVGGGVVTVTRPEP